MPGPLRHILRWSVRLAWCLGLLELGAFAGIWILQGERPSSASLAAGAEEQAQAELRGAATGQAGGDSRSFQQVRHPYLGYVARPEPRHTRKGQSLLSGLTMGDPSSPIYNPDAVVIGLTGGSVAAGVFNYGGRALVEWLEQQPQLAGKHVHLFCFATAGFKQPQQAVGLAYLLSAGVQFDAVVNLDGFNEVALTFDTGLQRGGFPSYPYSWSSRVALASVDLNLGGELSYLERERQKAATALGASRWRWSWLRKLAWTLKDRGLQADRERTLAVLRERQAIRKEPLETFEQLGPGWEKGEPDALQEELAAIWERSSRVMADLCEGAGAIYLHALQPNQYDPEFDKPMGPAEERKARSSRSKFAAPATTGYPFLRQARERLLADGLAVLDLKDLFAGVTEERFRDDCCHFNPEGNGAIALALAEALVAAGL